MGKKFKHTDSETKRQTVLRIEKNEISIGDAARELSVDPATITRWIQKWRDGNLKEAPTKRERELEKENERLKQTVGSLYFHIEQLKKMADYKRRMKDANTSVITGKNLDQFRKPVK
jgi:transposase-like protein